MIEFAVKSLPFGIGLISRSVRLTIAMLLHVIHESVITFLFFPRRNRIIAFPSILIDLYRDFNSQFLRGGNPVPTTSGILVVTIMMALHLYHVSGGKVLCSARADPTILHQVFERFAVVQPFTYLRNVRCHFQIISFAVTACPLFFILPKSLLIWAKTWAKSDIRRVHHAQAVNMLTLWHAAN